MTFQHLAVFLFAYCLTASVIAFISVFQPHQRLLRSLIFIVLVLGLVASIFIGSMIAVGENFLFSLFYRLTNFFRSDVLAVAMGFSAALPLILLLGNSKSSRVRALVFLFAFCGVLGSLITGGLSAGKEVLSPYFAHPESAVSNNVVGGLSGDYFAIEDYSETEIIPVRVAVSPSGKVYVSGHFGIAAQQGVVVQLLVNEDGRVTEKTVAKMLNRPYGLIAEENRLLVSRSGQFTQWDRGSLTQVSTGAITLLKDLDGDGVMDYYHDVVSGLPGAKGPDYLHQNNDLAISPSGELYVTTANHSDGHPARDSMEGVVLKLSGEDFEKQEIYATGLRNPFGLAFTDNGELFATDNDAQTGILGGNPGDKLLHVTEGSFFGHPFGDESDPSVRKPALRSKFALGGLTRAFSDKLPAEYKGQLFVVSYGEGRIMRVEMNRADEEMISATLIPVAIVPGAVDIAAAPNGDFYVAVYPNKIVRLRLI